jgi:hypothetical protein
MPKSPFPLAGKGLFFTGMINEFIIRIGTFLMLIGIGILILFLASEYAGQANFDYLFWAVLCVTAGIMLRRRKPPAPPSGRFGALRRFRNRPPSDNGEK